MPTIKIVPMPGVAGPQGEQGPRGYQGETGLTGPQGPAGADATFPEAVEWTPVLSNTGFAQSSNPATGTYFKYGKLVFVNLFVPLSNVTNFGSGQYSLTLPFAAARHTDVFGGSLHNTSSGDHYSLKGHLTDDSDQMTLWAISTATKDENFTPSYPISLALEDLFHMSFIYEIVED